MTLAAVKNLMGESAVCSLGRRALSSTHSLLNSSVKKIFFEATSVAECCREYKRPIIATVIGCAAVGAGADLEDVWTVFNSLLAAVEIVIVGRELEIQALNEQEAAVKFVVADHRAVKNPISENADLSLNRRAWNSTNSLPLNSSVKKIFFKSTFGIDCRGEYKRSITATVIGRTAVGIGTGLENMRKAFNSLLATKEEREIIKKLNALTPEEDSFVLILQLEEIEKLIRSQREEVKKLFIEKLKALTTENLSPEVLGRIAIFFEKMVQSETVEENIKKEAFGGLKKLAAVELMLQETKEILVCIFNEIINTSSISFNLRKLAYEVLKDMRVDSSASEDDEKWIKGKLKTIDSENPLMGWSTLLGGLRAREYGTPVRRL